MVLGQQDTDSYAVALIRGYSNECHSNEID